MPSALDTPILSWLFSPSSERGIRFASDDGSWEFWSYARLAAAARRVSHGLTRIGVRANECVCLLDVASPELIAALFGVMAAGASACLLPPPEAFQNAADYSDALAARLRSVNPSLLAVANRNLLPSDTEKACARIVTFAELSEAARQTHREPAPERTPPDIALVQFTSGSSRRGRGVKISLSALEGNVAGIRGWLEWTSADPIATWLPLHHDMGLVGCLITPVVAQADIALFQPRQFVRRPLRFLRCFGADGAVLTAMPNFALDYLVRRVRPDMLEGLDFSRWRGIVVGAETVRSDSLAAFHRLLGPFGLPQSSLLPAYGLAEATLTVSGLPLRQGWLEKTLDPAAMAPGRPIQPPRDAEYGTAVVGCGAPLAGIEVRIEDESGRQLSDGHVGEIVVTRGALFSGYLGDEPGSEAPDVHTRLVNRALCTGDMGFSFQGQLFVLGRLGDSLKIRGRVLFAEELEAALVRAGIASSRVAALLGWHAGRPAIVLVLEAPKPGWIETAETVGRRRAEGISVHVLEVPLGTIRRTTSGKPRRRELFRMFLTAGLPRLASRDDRAAGSASVPLAALQTRQISG